MSEGLYSIAALRALAEGPTPKPEAYSIGPIRPATLLALVEVVEASKALLAAKPDALFLGGGLYIDLTEGLCGLKRALARFDFEWGFDNDNDTEARDV